MLGLFVQCQCSAHLHYKQELQIEIKKDTIMVKKLQLPIGYDHKVDETEKEIKFTTPYNYKSKEQDKENPDPVSMTIPGQSYTIKELVEKHRIGIIPNISNNKPQYSENPTFDIIDVTSLPDFDLVDGTELKELIENKIKNAKLKKEADDRLKSENKVETEKVENQPIKKEFSD